MKPLKPSKLMKSQRFVIVGAFIVGAIISPTPDIMNQLLLALPIVGMYQVGVALVWFANRPSKQKKNAPVPRRTGLQIPDEVLLDLAMNKIQPIARKPAVYPVRRAGSLGAVGVPAGMRSKVNAPQKRFIDMQMTSLRRPNRMQPQQPVVLRHSTVQPTLPQKQSVRPTTLLPRPVRTVDSFIIPQTSRIIMGRPS